MQLALYRAERPEIFEDIIGQKQIVRILQNQIKSGSVSQAYLFTGTHGTGKTSTARILAKAVNCTGESVPCGECENCRAIKEGKFVDVLELDAASNNKVDDIRAIIDLVQYPPSIGKYKVVIIDEVHMLTTQAENAFLKTLEEPPEYVIFILATTDPQKVNATIRSRCMQLNFKRVSEAELVAGMSRICSKNGVEASDDALETIALKADGSVRDALTILEQCMAAGDIYIDRELALEYLGCAGREFYIGLTDAVMAGDLGRAFTDIDRIASEGKHMGQALKDWLEHYRNLMVVKYVEKADRIIGSSAENAARMKEQADAISMADIDRAIRLLSEYINIGRYSDRQRILLETAAVKLAGDEIQAAFVKPKAAASVSTEPVQKSAPMPGREVPKAQPAEPEHVQKKSEPAQEEPKLFDMPEQSEEEYAANLQLARATSAGGGAQEMWKRICDEMLKAQASFGVVAQNSRASNYENDEIVVTVKKNKMFFLDTYKDDISRIAKKLYGEKTKVVFVGGEVEAQKPERPEPAANENSFVASAEPEDYADAYVPEDYNPEECFPSDYEQDKNDELSDMAGNLSETFGIKISLTDDI